jgi:two-component system LytT family response regulator
MAKTIKVVIVDDEPLAREYIRQLLKDDSQIEIIGEAGNGRAALAVIAAQKPDLIFLDVQMPEMDGLELLKKMDRKRLPAIIFTTAYEEYAIRAFEFHAFDYLLKPFDENRFRQSVEDAKNRYHNQTEREQEQNQVTELLKNVEKPPRYLERLLIKQNGRIVFLKTDDIYWLKADDKYVHIHFGKNNRHLVRQTLAALKSQLDPQRFAQIHRSAIINVERIKELQPMFGGEHSIVMEDDSELTLSRNFKNELFELLGNPL